MCIKTMYESALRIPFCMGQTDRAGGGVERRGVEEGSLGAEIGCHGDVHPVLGDGSLSVLYTGLVVSWLRV